MEQTFEPTTTPNSFFNSPSADEPPILPQGEPRYGKVDQ